MAWATSLRLLNALMRRSPSVPASTPAEGTIESVAPRSLFRVRLDDGRVVLASVQMAARRVSVTYRPGDRVFVMVSDVDPSRGRIVNRKK